MLHMTYVSDAGTVVFTDQYGRNRVEEMTGFDLAPMSYETVNMGSAGQVTVGSTPAARAMTVKFELHYGGDLYTLQQAKARIVNALSKPGRLTIERFNTKRCIDVQQTVFEPGDRCELWQDCVVQFQADSPYFHDAQDLEEPVFREEDLLQGTFQLPKIFTMRYNDLDILISGAAAVRPVFELIGGEGALGGDDGVKIENRTTGVSILVHLSPAEGEVVTIDTATGDIISSTQGDMIAALDLESFLSDFWLEPGHNQIVVTNYRSNDKLSAVCVYNNNYVEACV